MEAAAMLNPNERVLKAMAALRYGGPATASNSGAANASNGGAATASNGGPSAASSIGATAGDGNPHFEVFLAWLRRVYLEQSERNDSQRDEVLLRMGQGRAMALAELVKALEGAPAILNRIRGDRSEDFGRMSEEGGEDGRRIL
jgi:hypothetical protein